MRTLRPLLLAAAVGACAPRSDDPCSAPLMDGSWLAFASLRSGDYGLRAVRVDGTCERPLVTAPTLELHPAVSSKGRLAFTSDRSGALRIWQVSPGAGEPSLLDTGDLRATSPAYSPDGATIAFEGQPTGAATTDLYVVPAAGGTPTPLAADPADDAGPAWSPDGSTLYFVSTRSGGYEIHSVVVATGAVSQLTTGSRIVGRPAVGPAGDRLYFARTVAVSTDTEVVRLVLASGVIEVVSSEQDSEPAVSPSGTRLALRTFRYGAANADLVLVNESDGGSAVRLTSNAGSDGSPAFFPRR